MEESVADSSDRTESDDMDGVSEGEGVETAELPAWQISSRIGPAEAEGGNSFGNARRIRKTEKIWRTEQEIFLVDMEEDGLLSGENILKIDGSDIAALIIVHFNGDEESVIRIEGTERRERVCYVVRKLLPVGQICFQLIATVEGIAGDEEFTGGGKGRNFRIIEHIRGRGRC